MTSSYCAFLLNKLENIVSIYQGEMFRDGSTGYISDIRIYSAYVADTYFISAKIRVRDLGQIE